MRIHSIAMLLIISSGWLCAVLSRQNAINRFHIGVSPLRNAYQTSVAQSAAPEGSPMGRGAGEVA
jgi:hypothetical protein